MRNFSKHVTLLMFAAQFSTAFAGLRENAPTDQDFVRPSLAMRLGDYLAAEGAYRDITVRFPRHVRAWNALGVCLATQNRRDEARAVYGQVATLYREHLQVDPHDIDAYHKLTLALLQADKKEEARAALKEGLLQNPGNAKLLAILNGPPAGTYEGTVGLIIRGPTGAFRVANSFPEFGGGKAGVLENDVIVRIDGKNTNFMSLEDVTTAMRGEIGTRVNLTVRREGQAEPMKIVVERVPQERLSSAIRERRRAQRRGGSPQ